MADQSPQRPVAPIINGESGGELRSSSPIFEGATPHHTPHTPVWAKVAPFFISAIFFLSAFFAIFSPLPLILLRFRAGRLWTWSATAVNAAIVAFAGGWVSLAMYLVFVASPSLLMPELLEAAARPPGSTQFPEVPIRQRTLEKAGAWSLFGIFVTAAGLIAFYSYLKGLSPFAVLNREVHLLIDFLSQSLGSQRLSELGVTDVEEWKRAVLLDFPSMVAISALAVIWANLVLLLRANPGRIRERLGLEPDFMRRWKAPEYLVWPTIVAGFFLIVDVGHASEVALNVFKFLMAIYAIQGMSVLGFFFETWRLKPALRTVGILAAIFLMMPLVLSLGFFDLWFDFRAKFRQS